MLAAEVDLYCGSEIYTRLMSLEDELRFVLISSYARVHHDTEKPGDAVHVKLEAGDELWVAVKSSAHAKCTRCWHFREDVGASDKHPELCGRCIDNVDGNGESRQFA